jgi:hypothetical protein
MSNGSYNSQKDVEAFLEAFRKRGMTWREISMLPGLYGIPFGTLERIAKGRETKNPVYRKLLGMQDLSQTCGQCFRITENSIRRMKASRPAKLRDYPVEMLRAAFKFREEL